MTPLILMPVYNDWDSVRALLTQLDAALPEPATVLLVDDGSTEPRPAAFPAGARVSGVEVLRLRRNLGHQRAIAVGLSYLAAERDAEPIVVMDADGEDRPEDVGRLLRAFREASRQRVVFAARMRRSENLLFRVCYHTYRLLHWLLTGIPVRVGNFSVLSRDHLAALTVMPDLWNHYAASVLKSKLPVAMVPTTRARRLAGQSKLNFVGMVVHGLSAISVFTELVAVRLSLATLLFLGALAALLAMTFGVAVSDQFTLPDWTALTIGLLLVLVVQVLTVALGFTLWILFNRNSLSFLPIRDYRFFVRDITPA